MPPLARRSISAATRRAWVLAYFLSLLCSFSSQAKSSDTLPPIPRLEACRQQTHPLLPSRWRGTFLMAPFTPTQLVLSEIVYDGPLRAMLLNLYGVRSGAARLLVLDDRTYSLSDPGLGFQCEELTDGSWRLLPRDWLAEGARCVGSAPISETSVQWWKTPIRPAPLTDWVWFKSSDGSPFRLLFQKPSDHLSILSSFALSYQVGFEVRTETNLRELASACANAVSATRLKGVHDVLDALQGSTSRADSELKRLLPDLDVACPADRPHWPEQLAMSMFLTPLDFSTDPLPAEVLYDWKLRSQRTRMFWPTESPTLNEDVLMLAASGYSVTRKRSGDIQCIPALPGTPRPYWIGDAPCTCEGTIGAVTPLTPYGPAQIFRCPATSPRLFWTWYTAEGRPMLFLVTPSKGDEPTALITLADYQAWVPGYSPDKAAFARPPQCPDVSGRPRAQPHPFVARPSEPCRRCHLTPDRPR
jgi:hypothetical protein